MYPVFVSRSFVVLSKKGNKVFTSNTFIVRLPDGSEKFINSKGWCNSNLLRDFELEATISEPYFEYLTKDNCCLYYKQF